MMDQEPGVRLRITTTAELLKAVELGIVDRTEARSLLGLGVKRGRMARLQPRVRGRFARSDEDDQVLPFNRFTAAAQDAMLEAQELSKARDGGHPDTADLLLAIVRQPDGAGAALLGMGAGDEQVSGALAGVERNETPVEGIGPSAQLREAVERAFHGVAYPAQVGTAQLVLALAATGGIASDVLGRLGVTEQALRAGLPDEGAEPA